MELIEHTQHWVRGEVLEAFATAAAGAVFAGLGVLAWRSTDPAVGRGLVLPLALLGGLLLLAGLGNAYGTQRRLAGFERAHAEDPAAFAQAERERVDGFQSLYTFTMVMAAVSFAGAVGLFAYSLDARARGAAIALVLLGLSGLVIDLYSKARADRYAQHIDAALRSETR